jgi:hypothetical protein
MERRQKRDVRFGGLVRLLDLETYFREVYGGHGCFIRGGVDGLSDGIRRSDQWDSRV